MIVVSLLNDDSSIFVTATGTDDVADGISTTTTKRTEEQHPVIEWLISKEVGGYFNTDAITVRDGGMYATKDINEGDLVMLIPPKALIQNGEDDDEDECSTARRLVYEYDILGKEKSFYWPYLQYVFESFPHRTVPLGWSKEGKKIIRSIVGKNLPPSGFGKGSYRQACGDYIDDEEEDSTTIPKFDASPELFEAAFRIVLSRGWHHVMVPVYDMVNHRNNANANTDANNDANTNGKISIGHNIDRSAGGYNNKETTQELDLDVDGDFHIVALRSIPAGHQLHNSYNQCHDATCAEIDMSYVTPQIVLDYGFVESYPRRFAFHTGKDTGNPYLGIVVEVTDDKKVSWLEPLSSRHLSAHQSNWLQIELERLVAMKTRLTERIDTHPNEHEAATALEYYHALEEVLQLMVKSPRMPRHVPQPVAQPKLQQPKPRWPDKKKEEKEL